MGQVHRRDAGEEQASAREPAVEIAPAVTSPRPLTSAPLSAILAMQRDAGNQAVARAISTARVAGLIQRAPPTQDKGAAPPAGPQLPPGRTFQWHRKGVAYWVLISKRWLLERGVEAEATEISDRAVMSELVSGLGEVAPWADIPTLQKNISSFIPMKLSPKLSEQPATLIVPLAEVPTGQIGNPPGEEVAVRVRSGEAVVWIDSGLIRRHLKQPTDTEIVDPGFTAQAFAALEAALNQKMGGDREQGWRASVYATWPWTLPGPIDKLDKSVAFLFEGEDLVSLFGEDWEEKVQRSAAKEAGRVKGNSVALPKGLEDDWPRIMAVLKEILGKPEGPKKKDEGRLTISEKDALLFLKIANNPLRDQIIARLKSSGGGDKGGSLSDVLETVIEEQELKDARKRLGLSDPGTSGDEPILKRPVHGSIVLTGGRPVPGKEAVFTFEVTDEVDALRAPLIQIQWMVYPQGKPKLIFDAETNMYSPLRGQGPVNDKLFEVTFPKAGTYVVEAIVNHNFYRTAHFKTEVKVLTEEEEVAFQEKGPLSGFASPTGGVTKKHDFDVGGVTSAVTDYEEGTITRGKLDPAFKAGTLAVRLKAIDEEIERVDKLFKQYSTRSGDQAASVRNWAEDYLKTLREGRAKIETEGKDSRLIPCTGVYVSRSKKAPSKALNLVCLQRKTDDGYHVSLHDLSQVYEAENYFFEVENATAEGAYEEIFVEAAEAYPDGTLSVAFQGWDEKKQAPTESYVKFRKVTDTLGKDIKSNVFDPAVNIAVNIAAAVMMVVPGLQAAGFALAIVWNTSQTIAELEEKAAKGTLKDKDFAYAAATFALDLLPVAGRSARMVTLGKKAFYVIEGVQLAGQALLITAQGAEQLEKVRNGVISKLAKLNEQISELERVNPSDPELEALRDRQEKLIKEGEDAVIEIYGGIVAQQGLMMVGGALIQQAAIKKFGGRIAELEGAGKFQHKDGEPVRYDYDQKKMVGDRQQMTQADFEVVERKAQLSEKLDADVADPALRKRIVETIADAPVEIVKGGKKTRLEVEGERQVLKIADGAKPDEILAEALRAKTGKAVTPEVPGTVRTGPEKAAHHRNELEHLEELHKMAATEGLDEFEIARQMRGQFAEIKRTVDKLPAGKEKAALEAFIERYRIEVYEPAAKLVDRLHTAGGPKALDRFQQLKPDARDFVSALSDDGMKAFFKLDHAQQGTLLKLDKRALDQIQANDPARQAQIVRNIDAHAKAAAQDVQYDVTTAAGTVRHQEGHPFREHGAHNTDATMFARAAPTAGNPAGTPKGRWLSPEAQVREVEHFRKRLMDSSVLPGSQHSPINTAGANAINAGTVTRDQILADPQNHRQYLKRLIEFHDQPSSNNAKVGESFHPDGVTKKNADKVTAVFQLDDNGTYQVLTAFPVE